MRCVLPDDVKTNLDFIAKQKNNVVGFSVDLPTDRESCIVKTGLNFSFFAWQGRSPPLKLTEVSLFTIIL